VSHWKVKVSSFRDVDVKMLPVVHTKVDISVSLTLEMLRLRVPLEGKGLVIHHPSPLS
jgi:hypothetical protein